MQRSDRLIIYIPIHSIPDGSSLRHGVNKIFHLFLGLFHPSLAGSLELVLAEERFQLFSMSLTMMLSLSTLFPSAGAAFGAAFDLPAAGLGAFTISRSRGISNRKYVSFRQVDAPPWSLIFPLLDVIVIVDRII